MKKLPFKTVLCFLFFLVVVMEESYGKVAGNFSPVGEVFLSHKINFLTDNLQKI